MTVFTNDSFTDSNGTDLSAHAGELGATWTKHSLSSSNTIKVASNRLYSDGSSAIYYASGVPSSAEYDVTCVMREVTALGANGFGFCGRMSTSVVTFYLVRYNVSNTRWELQKCVTGTFTSLGTFTETAWTGADRTVKLEIRDAAKKVYINGVERISSADNVITAAGRVGFRSGDTLTTSTGVHIDSIEGNDLAVAQTVSVNDTLTISDDLSVLETSAGGGSRRLVGARTDGNLVRYDTIGLTL